MPTPDKNLARQSLFHYKSLSYETLVASWLLRAGWEVLQPMIDHGLKTDLVISNGKHYYRIQVKSLETINENTIVENKWGDANVHFVIYFSRLSDWGYIVQPFDKATELLNSPGHTRFHQHPINFIKAFNSV